MSVAASIFEQSADVLAVTHDENLVLLPGDISVSGYVQDASDEKPGVKTFQIGNDLISHVVHIRRSQLAAVTVANIVSIRLGTKSYRVRHFKDDPNKPEISFHCTL